MFKIEGKGLEAEFDVHIQSSAKSAELDATYREMAKLAFQSNKVSLDVLTKLLTSDSMSEKRRVIENAERQAQAQQERQMESQQQMAQQQMQSQQQAVDKEIAAKERMNIRDNETKLALKQDNVSELGDFYDKLEEQKRQFDETLKQKDKHHADKLKLEEKKMAITPEK